MLYLDTSVLVALFSQESGSETAQQQLDDWLTAGRPAVCSDWAAAEFRCAIAAKHRAGLIAASDLPVIASALVELCADKLEAAASVPSDLVRAAELAIARPALRLRAGDALHIVMAARLGATHFLSFDQDQADAARQVLVGVRVLS